MRALTTDACAQVCNFLEESKVFGKDVKLVYRHYATLYFICAVDESESELGASAWSPLLRVPPLTPPGASAGVLDLIQVFVESLDRFFENVCELDLVYHTDKVHYVLDEIIMGGLVLETNLSEITSAVKGANKHEASTKSQHLRKSSIVASLQRKA